MKCVGAIKLWLCGLFSLSGVVMVALSPFVVSGWHPCCLGRIGVVMARPENLPLWVARSEQLFEQNRLNVEMIDFQSTSEILNGVQGRRLDIGYAADMALAVEQAAKNRDLVIIGSVVNRPLYYLVTTTGQLAGKRVGATKDDEIVKYFDVGSSAVMMTKTHFRTDMREFISPQDVGPALKAMTVDAVIAPLPLALQLEAAGLKVKAIGWSAVKAFAVYGVVISAEWTKNHGSDDPRMVELMAGLIKAHVWLRDPKNKERAIQILREWLPKTLAPERVYQEFIVAQRYIAATPEVDSGAIDELMNVLAAYGRVPTKDFPKELLNAALFIRARERK